MPSLASASARVGHTVQLFATGERSCTHPHKGFEISIFPPSGPATIGASFELAAAMRSVEADVLHSHGLWRRILHYADRRTRRGPAIHVIAPRGMMTEWAWNHRRRSKQLARWFLHPGALERTHGWHATSEAEADGIRALGFSQPICVAPNGVDIPSEASTDAAKAYWHSLCPEVVSRRTAVFYSRFHPKKRVLELLDLWLAVAPNDWLLLLVGIPETYSVGELQRYCSIHLARGRVRVYDGSSTPPPYVIANLFLLPSHSENFGLVVAESLANGTPFLVTNTTPWSEAADAGCGWCVPWELFGPTLSMVLALNESELRSRGSMGREWVRRRHSWESAAYQLSEFYTGLLSKQ